MTVQQSGESADAGRSRRGGEVTALLGRWRDGDLDARERVVDLLYDELRGLAKGYMHKERRDHTLQGTELVHEAMLRLFGWQGNFHDRAHFFRAAAQAMRRILVDHARRVAAGNRFSPDDRLPFEVADDVVDLPRTNLLELDQALSKLEAFDPKLVQVVELRCFIGLSIPEVAEIQEVSESSVSREWKHAKAWLRRALGPASSS